MKRWIGLLAVALLGFYVAWPAWSAYRISAALTSRDEAALANKVDFPAVRASLRPLALAEITKKIDKESAAMGPMGQALAASLKAQMSGQFVEQILDVTVTPRAVIRIANDGGDVAASIEKAVSEASGQLGGVNRGGAGANGGSSSGIGGVLGRVPGMTGGVIAGSSSQPAATPAAEPAPAGGKARAFGLGNIKGFGMAGPFGFNVAVARDAAQATSDVIVGMSFTGTDWKLTRVVPNL